MRHPDHGFQLLSSGQEAVAVGVCAALTPDDQLLSSGRSIAPALARGVEPGAVMAELLGKAAGPCGGRGGRGHLAQPSIGILRRACGGRRQPHHRGRRRARDAVARAARHRRVHVRRRRVRRPARCTRRSISPRCGGCRSSSSATTTAIPCRRGRPTRSRRRGSRRWPRRSASPASPSTAWTCSPCAMPRARSRTARGRVTGPRSSSACRRASRRIRRRRATRARPTSSRPTARAVRSCAWPRQLEAEGALTAEARAQLERDAENAAEAAVRFADASPYPDASELLRHVV